MAKTTKKDDWLDFGGDVPWSSPGDSTDWANVGNLTDNGAFYTDPNAQPYDNLPVNDPGAGHSLGGDFGSVGGVGGLAALLGQGGTSLASIARALGLTNSSGGVNLAGVAGLLSPLLGGIASYRATNNAANSLNAGIGNANAAAQSAFDGAANNFTPYRQAGQTALATLSGQAPSNLASQFGPLGSGRGIPLSMVARR